MRSLGPVPSPGPPGARQLCPALGPPGPAGPAAQIVGMITVVSMWRRVLCTCCSRCMGSTRMATRAMGREPVPSMLVVCVRACVRSLTSMQAPCLPAPPPPPLPAAPAPAWAPWPSSVAALWNLACRYKGFRAGERNAHAAARLRHSHESIACAAALRTPWNVARKTQRAYSGCTVRWSVSAERWNVSPMALHVDPERTRPKSPSFSSPFAP